MPLGRIAPGLPFSDSLAEPRLAILAEPGYRFVKVYRLPVARHANCVPAGPRRYRIDRDAQQLGHGADAPLLHVLDPQVMHQLRGPLAVLDYPVDLVPPNDGDVLNVQIKNVSEPCPPDYSKRVSEPRDPYPQSVYWTLRPDRADAFYADLLTNTGIGRSKTKLGNYNFGNVCGPNRRAGDRCWSYGYDYGIPMPDGFGEKDVADPHEVVSKALDNSNSLVDQVSRAVRELRFGAYSGDSFELVDSISLPVLMIAEAVESMAQVETVADKIDEAKRKALILAFLSAILFLVPIAGEVFGAVAELADISTILAVVGVVGNTALDVYTIIDDPHNAPLAIFSLILEPLALADIAKVSKAASIRRNMKEADVAKLGKTVASRSQTITKIKTTCRRT